VYVCFCFAISSVFQAFFVSYLVEPKYEKKLETLDELLDSNVVYGDNSALNVALGTVPYPELMTFLDHKRLKEDCSDFRKCVERMVTKRDIALFIDPVLATYFAREMGTVDVGKVLCSLDESLMSVGLTVLFKKGNPLLDRFNTLMESYLEAGLLERHWTELQHRSSLRSGGRFREAAGDMIFVFTVSHLMPAFVVLLVGTVLSLVVFVGELTVNCLGKRKEKKNLRIRRVRVLYRYRQSYYRRRLMLF